MPKQSEAENQGETMSVLGVEGTTVSLRMLDEQRIVAVVAEPLGRQSRTVVIRPLGCVSTLSIHYSEIFSAFIFRGASFETTRAIAKAQREKYETREPTP